MMAVTTFYKILLAAMIFVTVNIKSTLLEESQTIQTIVYTDSENVEHEEYAFRPPMKGVPGHVMEMYCANVKLRLYWETFREQVKGDHRRGAHLKRLARFARVIYSDIQGVDKPFNATMLSRIDGLHDKEDELADKTMMSKTIKILKKIDSRDNVETISSLELEIEAEKNQLKSLGAKIKTAGSKVKSYVAEYSPKIGLGIYTRVRTMWWLMMPCLYAKYYLWDPALDEFNKLKRSLVMYPDMQLLKLKDLDCKPLRLFKRILDTCKLLNPLMNYSFGQMSLDKLTRFKSDMV